jgi:predicted Zn-dependent peptidase
VALVGVARSTPDFDALTVMNTLLGGKFSSRLNLNLREKHAYTYGAGSGFAMRRAAGPFSAGGAIVTKATAPAIREIFRELERLRAEPVSESELADAKANLIRQLPARFETASETAASVSYLAIHALPLDEYATRPQRFARVTREDIQAAARGHLVLEKMRVVVVGDASAIKDDLGKLGGRLAARSACNCVTGSGDVALCCMREGTYSSGARGSASWPSAYLIAISQTLAADNRRSFCGLASSESA